MQNNTLIIIVSLICAIFSATSAFAQDINTLNSIKAERAAIKDESNILKARLARQKEDLVVAKAEIVETEQKMAKAFDVAKNEPSERTARLATLISITYNRNEKRIERVTNRIAGTEERLANNNNKLKALARKEDDIKRQAKQIQQKRAHKEKELKLQAKAKQAVKPQAVAKKEVRITKPSTPKKPSPPPRIAGWPDIKNPHKDDINFAKASLKAAQRQLEKGDKPLLPKVTIESKQSFGSERMSYIGDDMYLATVRMKAGYQKVTVFKKSFWVDIPQNKDTEEFQLIYDATSLSKPKLIAIEAKLLRDETEGA